MSMPHDSICPFCGAHVTPPTDPPATTTAGTPACPSCKGLLEPLSRQASQNAMGPWFVRDETNPFRPGCNLSTIRMLIERGKVVAGTIVRGPSTGQFWRRADRVPGLAHVLGVCHACAAAASPDQHACEQCGVSFEVPDDRQQLGLGPVRMLPGQASAESIADRALARVPYAPTTTSHAQEPIQESGVTPPVTREARTIPVAPDPDALVTGKGGKAGLTAEQRAAKLARIEAEAQALLQEQRQRSQGRQTVIGLMIGLLALAALLAVITLTLPSSGRKRLPVPPPLPPAPPASSAPPSTATPQTSPSDPAQSP